MNKTVPSSKKSVKLRRFAFGWWAPRKPLSRSHKAKVCVAEICFTLSCPVHGPRVVLFRPLYFVHIVCSMVGICWHRTWTYFVGVLVFVFIVSAGWLARVTLGSASYVFIWTHNLHCNAGSISAPGCVCFKAEELVHFKPHSYGVRITYMTCSTHRWTAAHWWRTRVGQPCELPAPSPSGRVYILDTPPCGRCGRLGILEYLP